MKKTFLILAVLTTLLSAFDMGVAMDSVDKKKAKDSIKTDKAMAAVAKGSDIEMKDVKESVDSDKALDSVDKSKLMKSMF